MYTTITAETPEKLAALLNENGNLSVVGFAPYFDPKNNVWQFCALCFSSEK